MLNWLKKTTRIFLICYFILLICILYQAYASKDVSLSWLSLGKPPEEITRLADVDDISVIVETTHHNFFYCKVNTPVDCWIAKDFQKVRESVLQCWRGELPKSDAIQLESSCANAWHNFGYRQTLYELSYDGNVYVKQRVVIEIMGHFLLIFSAGIITFIILPLINVFSRKLANIVT